MRRCATLQLACELLRVGRVSAGARRTAVSFDEIRVYNGVLTAAEIRSDQARAVP